MELTIFAIVAYILYQISNSEIFLKSKIAAEISARISMVVQSSFALFDGDIHSAANQYVSKYWESTYLLRARKAKRSLLVLFILSKVCKLLSESGHPNKDILMLTFNAAFLSLKHDDLTLQDVEDLEKIVREYASLHEVHSNPIRGSECFTKSYFLP